MSDKYFNKPTTVQDFAISIAPEDIGDGRVKEEHFEWIRDTFLSFIHRFEPQVVPGKGFKIEIRMETWK